MTFVVRMTEYKTVHLDPEVWDMGHGSFKPHEDWSERIKRAFEAELELERIREKSSSKLPIAPHTR